MTVITSIPVPADSSATWAEYNGRSASWVTDDADGNSWYAWNTLGGYEVVRINRDGVQIQYGESFYGDDHTHVNSPCDFCGTNRKIWVIQRFPIRSTAVQFAQDMAAGRTANFVCKTRYTPPAVLALKGRID